MNSRIFHWWVAKFSSIFERNVPEKYTLSDHLWKYLQDYAKKHKAAGNGFGYGLFSGNDIARTLSARYHKDGSEILIKQQSGKNPRRLTPRELQLDGISPQFSIPVSDTQAYRQFGNSVVIPVIQSIAKQVVSSIKRPVEFVPDLALTLMDKPNSPVAKAEKSIVRYKLIGRKQNKTK